MSEEESVAYALTTERYSEARGQCWLGFKHAWHKTIFVFASTSGTTSTHAPPPSSHKYHRLQLTSLPLLRSFSLVLVYFGLVCTTPPPVPPPTHEHAQPPPTTGAWR